MTSETFSFRDGAVDFGKDYEYLIPAYYSLVFSLDDEMVDFKMSTNNKDMGDFDDVVMEIELKNGEQHVFALQLKHIVRPIAQIHLVTNNKKFSLKKYSKEFIAVKTNYNKSRSYNAPFQNFHFILFSNSVLEKHEEIDENWTRLEPIADGKKINSDLLIRQFDDYFEKKFLNLGETDNGINFKLKCVQNDSPDKEFFQQFSFYTRQKHAKELEALIADTILKTFKYCSTSVVINYLKYFYQWCRRDYGCLKLTKTDVRVKLAELLLTSHIQFPNLEELTTVPEEQSSLVLELCGIFDMIPLEKPPEIVLNKIWTIILKHCKTIYSCSKSTTFSDLNNALLKKNIELPLSAFGEAFDQIALKRFYVMLWHTGLVPLIVKIAKDTPEHEHILHAVKLCENKLNTKKFILVDNYSFEGINDWKIFRNLTDLTSFTDLYGSLIKQLSISLQGRESIFLKQFVEIDKRVSENITMEEIILMLDGNFVVGSDCKKNFPKYYSTRQIPKVLLSTKLFDEVDDLFVVSYSETTESVDTQFNINVIDVNKYLFLKQNENVSNYNPKQFKFSYLQKIQQNNQDINDKFLILTRGGCTEEQLEKISFRNPLKNCHYVRFLDKEKVEWIESRGGIQKIQKYRLDSVEFKSDDFVKDVDALTHFSNKINLICSEPGMGKSVMMQFLKMQYSSDFWILSINLGEHSEFFKQEHNVKDILNYFLENEEANSFGRKTAEIYFSKKQLIFLWDGFDELPGICADSVIDSVKNLASEGYSQWLSARSDLRESLESAFNTLSLTLTQVSQQDQLYYILRHLNEKYDPIKSLQIATKMSENISAYLNCGYFDYTGIPLLIHMFVEIYLRTPEDQMNDVLIITLTDMYDEFIRTRFNILFERAEADSENYYMRQIQEQYLDSQLPLYEIAAVKASFEEELFQGLNLNCDELVNEVKESEDSLGLIVRINDHGKPVFTHKTYEEFLTASWLSKNYKNHLNLLVVLFQENHRNIRFMFDMILAKDSPVHLAVLYRNLEILKLHEAQIKHCRDSGGRSALHLACSWGSVYPPVKAIRNNIQEVDEASETITIRINSPIKSYEQDTLSLPIINFLLNKNCDVLEDDHYLKWNSFHYADQALFVGAIDLMLEQVHIDRELLVNYNHIPTLVHYASFSCLNELFELVDEIPYMKYNLEFIKINLLEVAANSNNLFAVCRILEFTIYKNVLKLESDVASSTLSSAVRFGNVQMLSVLLENGAKVNGHKKPPLIVAVVENSLQCFEKLLRAGANVDELSDEGHSALVASARFNRQEFAKLLLENGADINHTSTDLTALDCAIQHNPQLVPFLVQYKPDLNRQSKKLGLTSLHVASEVGNPDIIKYLLEHGADAKIKSKQLLTPLHVALANGKRENALVLIEADLSVIDEPCQNDEGYLVTPVLLAANKNFPDIVGILCEYGVDVDSTQCTTSPLHTASYHGFDSCIVKLIEAGASVNRLDTQGESPLFCSVNHLTTLQVLLQNSADVNIKNQWGVTALHEAANVGKIESAEELIKAGANVNAKDNANRTSLFYSIEKKHYEMAKLLLDSGSTVDDGGELLCRAARSDFPDGISLLLERGVNVDAKDSRGKSALHDASLGGNSCVEALLKAGANPNLLDHSNLTPLMCSIISSKNDATERLIKSGAALNPRRDCRTPLHLACCFGDIFSTILLIKYGADVNASDEYGLTPLHHVSGNNQTAMLLQELLKEKSQDDEKIYISYNGEDCAKELLENGANVNQKNSMGYVPLHVACTDKISNLVKLFIEYGADVNALNSMNQSPLHICFSLGNVEDSDILLENGADLDIVDLFGKTPLEYVMDRMHLEGETNLTVLEKLVKLRANIVLPDDTESMKLHKACFEGSTEMVRSLLDNGADPEGNSFEGIPPIFYACVGNHKETVGILLERRCQVNVYDDAEGVSPLILAVLSSDEDIIKLLLSSYTSIQADAGSALLRTACSLGMINKSKILLEAGVQTDRVDNRGCTALHYAITEKNFDLVQILVQHGAVIDQKSLSLAVETNRTEIVKLLVEKEQHLDFNANNLISIVLNANPKFFDLLEYLLKKGSDPNSSCGDVTNLGKACKIDCFGSVRCLLQNGANVNGRGAKGTTPLMLTYSNMDLRIATLLVSSGANVNQKDDQGWTALLYASHYGNLELVQFLHKSGADISLENDVGTTALTEAHQHTSIIKYLLQNGANINHKGENDSTILFRTCFHGNYEGALYLIENGADVNGVTEFEHFTPLHGAAFMGHVEIVKLLLSSNANLTIKSSVGTTPIVTAVDQNKLEVIKLFAQELRHLEATGNKNGILDKSELDAQWHKVFLRAAGLSFLDIVKYLHDNNLAPVNAKDQDNLFTALHYACYRGKCDVVHYLLENGADVNAQSCENGVPLLYASRKGYLEIVKLLVKGGAKLDIPNSHGNTGLYCAAASGFLEIVEFLYESGAKIHVVDADGDTPLHDAAFKGHLSTVKYLISKNAHVNHKDRNGKTALDLAVAQRNEEIATLLKANT